MKRTNKKVVVKNGTRKFERTVYVNENGTEFFKYNNKFHEIYQRDNGTFTAPWFTRVKYI